jgi:protein phosphatase PTC1
LLIQNVNPKPNNKLRAQNKQKQNNNPNKIIIIANNNKLKQNINNINTGDEDAKYTLVNDKEIDLNMRDNNEENLHEEHLDLFFISYSYCEDANLEHRKEMEDFHYIKALLNKKLNCSYFGLFDGHSGKEVGHYLMQNLHKIISQEIKKNNNIENSDDMKEILKNSFEAIDKEINRQNFKNETGSTGTVLLLYKDNDSKTGKSLICANVGDSKAYLINKTEIKLITKDHKCSDADEVKRIRDTGGVVFRERVFGTLMLTRSFGDKEMKKYGVLSTPDIFCHNIEDDDLFIVIASDGVWDVVEEDEVFKFSQDKISSSEFSKKIIQLAKERDTHDNISCIVVKLNKNM